MFIQVDTDNQELLNSDSDGSDDESYSGVNGHCKNFPQGMSLFNCEHIGRHSMNRESLVKKNQY